MKKKYVQWLEGELPTLVENEILTAENAERVSDYYRSQKTTSLSQIAIILCGALGATLIGSGIILLLAHNWEELTRPMRTVLAFVPMVLGQALVGFTLFKHPTSTVMRESYGAFLTISIGICIALIGQTYHIPGNLTSFLFVWLLLGLPVLYLMRSTLVGALYIVGSTAWVISSQEQGGHALWYGPLLVAIAPFLWFKVQHQRELVSTRFLGWVLCLNLCLSLGFCLERNLPGIWIVSYTSMFAVFYLIGRTWYQELPGQPFTIIGVVSMVVIAVMLTFDEFWREIGYHYYRHGYNDIAAIQDYLITLGLMAVATMFTVRRVRQGDRAVLAWVACPLLALVFFVIMNFMGNHDVSMVAVSVFNVYLFVLGIVTLISGVKEGQLGMANCGIGILSTLFIFRFFDSNLDFVTRGIAFILIGTCFLVINWLTVRRGRNASGEVS